MSSHRRRHVPRRRAILLAAAAIGSLAIAAPSAHATFYSYVGGCSAGTTANLTVTSLGQTECQFILGPCLQACPLVAQVRADGVGLVGAQVTAESVPNTDQDHTWAFIPSSDGTSLSSNCRTLNGCSTAVGGEYYSTLATPTHTGYVLVRCDLLGPALTESEACTGQMNQN